MSLGGARPSTPTSRIFTIRGLSRSPGGWKVYRIRGSGKMSWWWRERMLTESRAVTVLLGLTLAFYHGLWLPGLVLIKRDAFRLHLPIKQYLIERLSAGELPQWFPYEALGRPFIGVTHTGVFHPFTSLYFLLLTPDAYRASTLLSCLLAAVGAFVLGRKLNLSRSGGLVGGVAFRLACIQLGPAAAVFANSTRAQPSSFHEHALYWSSHPLRLVTVLASPIGENADLADVGHFFFGTRPLEGRGGPCAESL